MSVANHTLEEVMEMITSKITYLTLAFLIGTGSAFLLTSAADAKHIAKDHHNSASEYYHGRHRHPVNSYYVSRPAVRALPEDH